MGHDDYVLFEDDEFGGEETPTVRKGGGRWAAAGKSCISMKKGRGRGKESFWRRYGTFFPTSTLSLLSLVSVDD
jgi:hypothetical protein